MKAKASELRIGNMVLEEIIENGEPTRLVRRTIEGADLGHLALDGSFYKGGTAFFIPLTEEWLLKFGFIKIYNYCAKKQECDWEIDMDSTLDLCFEPDEPSHFWPTFRSKLEIKYVHQLQNLYFALTGEELMIQ